MSGGSHFADRISPSLVNRDISLFKDVLELPFLGVEMKIDRVAVIVCREGSFSMKVSGKFFEVLKGEIFICNSNDVISDCVQSENFLCDILSIEPFVLWKDSSQVGLWSNYFGLAENPLLTYSEENYTRLNLYRDLIWLKMHEGCTGINKEILVYLVRSLVFEIMKMLEEQSKGYKFMVLSRKEVIFRDFIDMLRALKVKERQVQWYADKLCITPKYLSLICKSITGKTAIEWINEYVRRDIDYLLKNTDKSIKEIADSLHFQSISFFGKYTKAYSNMSPREYRKYLKSQE